MRASILLVICWLSGVFVAPAFKAAQRDPFVPMAVTYRSELTSDGDRADADFEVIQTLGFNSVRVTVGWAEGERVRGTYELGALERALALAAKWKLRVVLHIDTTTVPSWATSRYADGRLVVERGAQSSGLMCLDHPGVRADVGAFVAAASARASRSAAWEAIEFEDVAARSCQCRYTQERYRAWLKSTYGREARPATVAAADRAAFDAASNREHFDFLANAASAVSLYGVAVPPVSSQIGPLQRPQAAFALDAVRGSSSNEGWLMIDRRAAGDAASTAAVDLRLWTWLGLSRGARGVVYGDWRAPNQSDSGALVEADGTITSRGRAAGALARIIGRNQALFASLRPRQPAAAIVYDRVPDATGGVTQAKDSTDVYASLIRHNIPVDVLQPGAVAPDATSRYKAIFVGPAVALPPNVAMTLKRFAEAGGVLVTDAGALTEERLIAVAAKAGIVPEVRVEGATGSVETRFLESSEVAMIVAINHADTPERVNMTFAPDVQEAIWQNMETGAAVNFVAGPDGPRYTYNFGPRDAFVLMIRKAIR